MADWNTLINQGKAVIDLGLADPTISGYAASVGAQGYSNETPSRFFNKTGAGDTDWTLHGVNPATIRVADHDAMQALIDTGLYPIGQMFKIESNCGELRRLEENGFTTIMDRLLGILDAGSVKWGMRYGDSAASNYNVTVKSDTGYAAIVWWDGTVELGGTGVAATNITFFKEVPASGGLWSGRAEKFITAMASSNGVDADAGGSITYINSVKGYLSYLDLSLCTTLTYFLLGGTYLFTADFRCNADLEYIKIDNGQLSTLDLSNMANLTQVLASNNILTSINLEGASSMVYLYLPTNRLTKLDISDCATTWNLINVSDNLLTSIRAVGKIFPAGSIQVELGNNQLSASALNQFFTDLAAGGATIDVVGNPGAATCDTSIATAKGYSVLTA